MTQGLVQAPSESLPLNRTLRAVLALNRAMVALHLLPRAEDIHLKLSMEKRQAVKSQPWMLTKASAEIATEDAATDSGIGLRIYLPPDGSEKDTTVLYIHGGGFTVGSPASADWLCGELAASGFPVVSVDYRLSPECPYPGPLDDVLEGLHWVDTHRDRLGTVRIAVAGDSAGGNLAAALCLRVAGDGGPRIDKQVLIYPGLDATLSSPSMSAPTKGLTRADVAASVRNYAGSTDPADPTVSPLLAPDLRGLPAAMILTGEHDVLRDDGRRYAERLSAAGVSVFFRQYPGMPHAFFSIPKLCGRPALDALDDLIRFLST